jgi:hypothetical protein
MRWIFAAISLLLIGLSAGVEYAIDQADTNQILDNIAVTNSTSAGNIVLDARTDLSLLATGIDLNRHHQQKWDHIKKLNAKKPNLIDNLNYFENNPYGDLLNQGENEGDRVLDAGDDLRLISEFDLSEHNLEKQVYKKAPNAIQPNVIDNLNHIENNTNRILLRQAENTEDIMEKMAYANSAISNLFPYKNDQFPSGSTNLEYFNETKIIFTTGYYESNSQNQKTNDYSDLENYFLKTQPNLEAIYWIQNSKSENKARKLQENIDSIQNIKSAGTADKMRFASSTELQQSLDAINIKSYILNNDVELDSKVSFNDPNLLTKELDPKYRFHDLLAFSRIPSQTSYSIDPRVHPFDYQPELKKSRTPKNYALVIGIDDYEKYERLGACVNDAERIAGLLKTLDYEVIELTDNSNIEPTKYNILECALKELSQKAKSGNVIIYYSGHGRVGEANKFYFIPKDAKGNWSSCISLDELAGYLKGINNISLIIDACNSGAVRLDPVKSSCQLIMASSKENEASNEQWFGSNSVFTYNLIRAIEMEREKGEEISLVDCFQEAKNETILWSSERLLSQNPVLIDNSNESYFV